MAGLSQTQLFLCLLVQTIWIEPSTQTRGITVKGMWIMSSTHVIVQAKVSQALQGDEEDAVAVEEKRIKSLMSGMSEAEEVCVCLCVGD